MISALGQYGISLQLTPMQLPEAVPQPGVMLAGSEEWFLMNTELDHSLRQ